MKGAGSRLAIAVFAVLWLLAPRMDLGIAATRSAAWSQYQGDAGHTGFNATETIVGPSNVSSLVTAWIANAGQGAPGPAVADGLVFVAGSVGNSHRLLAFDATTGDMAWSHRVDFDLPSPPAVQGGRVFDVSPLGTVYALDAATGARVWTASVGGSDASPAVAAAGGALFVASESGVSAFDASNGSLLWSTSVRRRPTAVTVAAGRVFVVVLGGVRSSKIFALDAATGGIQWISHGLGQFLPPVVATGRTVYVTASKDNGSRVVALSAGSGPFEWETSVAGISTMPAVAGSFVYAGAEDGTVDAFDATGNLLFTAVTESASPVFEPPIVANGVLYVSTDRPYGVDSTNGSLLWLGPVMTTGPAALALLDGVLYASTIQGGKLWSFRLAGAVT